MANLKYKDNHGNWISLSTVRGPIGPEGPQGPIGPEAQINLNGSQIRNPSFYAPLTSGTVGQILTSNGNGAAPTWQEATTNLEVVNNLNTSTASDTKVLGAYEGYVLNQNKVDKSTTVAGIDLQDNITITELVNALKAEIMLAAHPIGSLYFSEQATSPETLFGGTWTRITDTFILAAGSEYAAGTSGGSANLQAHTHSVNITSENNSVDHTHSIPSLSGSALSDGSHKHKVTSKTTSYASGNQPNWRCMSFEGTNADYNQNVYSSDTGAHTHSVTTDASTTGKISQKHTHTVSGTTNSTGDGNAGNMPPYKAFYCWKRTA